MNPPTSKKALGALASEHGLPILRYLRGRDWAHASQVAEALGIHTTTASKHLAAFYEAGFLERRDHAAKRPTFAYRLKSPVIHLELDLAERVASSDAIVLGSAIFEALHDSVHRVGGNHLAGELFGGLFGGGDWRPAFGQRIAAAADPRSALLNLVEDARRTLAGLVGSSTAGQLLRMAVETASDGRADIASAIGLEASR